jgi:hypothetical protein
LFLELIPFTPSSTSCYAMQILLCVENHPVHMSWYILHQRRNATRTRSLRRSTICNCNQSSPHLELFHQITARANGNCFPQLGECASLHACHGSYVIFKRSYDEFVVECRPRALQRLDEPLMRSLSNSFLQTRFASVRQNVASIIVGRKYGRHRLNCYK